MLCVMAILAQTQELRNLFPPSVQLCKVKQQWGNIVCSCNAWLGKEAEGQKAEL